MTKNFETLKDKVLSDPERRARVEKAKEEAELARALSQARDKYRLVLDKLADM